MLEFSLGNAFMHFARADAPPGFLWKQALSYALFSMITLGLSIFLMGGLYLEMLTLGEDPDENLDFWAENWAPIFGVYGLLMPLGFATWAIFEASFQRRYMRGDGFKLRFGGDELRLIVVGLFWLMFFFLAIFGPSLIIGVLGAISTELGTDGGGLQVIAVLIGAITFLVPIYFAVRFSAASALTIRDRKIQITSSWRVTRGRFWGLFGSYIAIIAAALGAYIVFSIVIGIAALSGMALLDADLASRDASEAFADPLLIGTLGFIYFVGFMASAIFGVIWGGPAALAARTDPEHGGRVDPAEAFS
ncbi:MAG: hypothetical protein AAGK23_12005 [Pseudomonadota bacterium]